MEEKVIFDEARTNIVNYFNNEFKDFDKTLLSMFINRYNDLLNYYEESNKFKPKIIFTNNIEQVIKYIPKAYMLPIFVDDSPVNYNSRLKPIIALAKKDWCIYIDIKENKLTYGLCKALNSIKDKDFFKLIEESQALKDRADKISCITVKGLNFYTMQFYSISGNSLIVNSSLDSDKKMYSMENINEFVDDCFSKLRTTSNKLTDIKTMYTNIFSNVIDEVSGAICVVVDKEYVDNGFFEDGIWLKEPISFSKLFSQVKSYSEEKLQAFVSLFIGMLSFDGITVVDNCGRIRAYNIFVESDTKRTNNIVGGARKRAAYTILNSRRKHLIGVYFQSHEGEVFYKKVSNYKAKAKPKAKPKNPVLTQPIDTKPLPTPTAEIANQQIDASVTSTTPTTDTTTITNKM